MGAAVWTRGGKKQDFGKLWTDFGTCSCQFLGSKCFKNCLFSGLFPDYFLNRCLTRSFYVFDSKSRFSHEGLAKVDISRKSFLLDLGVDVHRFLEALEAVFPVFRP